MRIQQTVPEGPHTNKIERHIKTETQNLNTTWTIVGFEVDHDFRKNYTA